MNIHERLRQRARAQFAARPPDEQARIRKFFTDHPDSAGAFMFYDGRMEDSDAVRARMTSRTAQLVSIATEGFPVPVSRWELG